MATNFAPVELEGIEQGKFLEALREAFDTFSHDIVKYVEDAEAKGKPGKIVGKVSADIEVQYKDGGFILSTAVATKMPSKVRTGASMTFQAKDVEGRSCLFAKETGTDRTDPKQQTLCNDDGSTPEKTKAEKK